MSSLLKITCPECGQAEGLEFEPYYPATFHEPATGGEVFCPDCDWSTTDTEQYEEERT